MEDELLDLEGGAPQPDAGVPTPNVEPDLDLFDVVDDNEADNTPDLEAIMAENARLKQQADLAASMQAGFQSLAGQFKQPEVKPQFDPNNLPGIQKKPENNFMPQLPNKDEWQQEFYVDPMSAIAKLLSPVMQTQQYQTQNQMAELSKIASRSNALIQDDNKPLFSKYGAEIEAYANQYKSNDPYGDAIKQVRINHYAELQNEAIEAAKQKAIEDYKASLTGAKPNTPHVGGTTLGVGSPPPAKKNKVTRTEMNKIDNFLVANFGGTPSPEYKVWAYEHMKANGML